MTDEELIAQTKCPSGAWEERYFVQEDGTRLYSRACKIAWRPAGMVVFSLDFEPIVLHGRGSWYAVVHLYYGKLAHKEIPSTVAFTLIGNYD